MHKNPELVPDLPKLSKNDQQLTNKPLILNSKKQLVSQLKSQFSLTEMTLKRRR